MSKELRKLFDFEGLVVRVFDRDDGPWFTLVDVCRAVEIGNPSQAVTRLDDDEKATITNNEGRAGNGAQTFTIINESGLYSLILTSRKPAAKRFKKWVTSVVLPAVRKDGAYIMGEETGEMSEDELLSKALIAAMAKIERQKKENEALTAKVVTLQPKADLVEAHYGKTMTLSAFARTLEGVHTMNTLYRITKSVSKGYIGYIPGRSTIGPRWSRSSPRAASINSSCAPTSRRRAKGDADL